MGASKGWPQVADLQPPLRPQGMVDERCHLDPGEVRGERDAAQDFVELIVAGTVPHRDHATTARLAPFADGDALLDQLLRSCPFRLQDRVPGIAERCVVDIDIDVIEHAAGSLGEQDFELGIGPEYRANRTR